MGSLTALDVIVLVLVGGGLVLGQFTVDYRDPG